MQQYAMSHQTVLDQAFRRIDALMPGALQQVQLAASADIARTLTGPSALTGVREAMWAQAELQRVLLSPAWQLVQETMGLAAAEAYSSQLSGLSAAIRAVQELPRNEALWYASAAVRRVERLNTVTVTAWRRFAIRPPSAPEDVIRLGTAGRTTYGLVSASALVTRVASPAEAATEPWLTAPVEMRDDLLERLRELDPGLPGKLHGAWDRASRPGPSAASQVANTLVELIDWSLRLAAPDEEVLAWHTSTHRSPAELNRDLPTRRLKVRYLMRDRDPDGRAADAYGRHLSVLLEGLQGGKHHLEDEDVAIVKHMIPAVEGFLGFVLLSVERGEPRHGHRD
jgi:hypothetical protein